jgi:CRP/FNR family transcriptional regulator, cyclic AMP receptor protein
MAPSISITEQRGLFRSALLQDTGLSDLLHADHVDKICREVVLREVAEGGLVCQKGEVVESWIGVVRGLVKIAVITAEGKSASFTGVPGGGWLGEGSLLKSEARRYSVVALRDSVIAYVPRKTFQFLLDNSIGFNRFLLRQINERLGQFIAMVEYERLLGPEAKLARCLAQMCNPVLYPGTGQRLEVSQQELGLLTGLSRQRVNQALQTLEAEGLLKAEYGGITLLDLGRLAQSGD